MDRSRSPCPGQAGKDKSNQMEPRPLENTTTSELMIAFPSMNLLLEVVGDERSFNRITAIEDGGTGTLVFVEKEEYMGGSGARASAVGSRDLRPTEGVAVRPPGNDAGHCQKCQPCTRADQAQVGHSAV